MKTPWIFVISPCLFYLLVVAGYGQDTAVTAPRQSRVEVFDLGYARVLESRMLSIPAGNTPVRIPYLPSSLDPTSVQVKSTGEALGFDIQSTQFIPRTSGIDSYLNGLRGKTVDVVDDGVSYRGTLLQSSIRENGFSVTLETEAGTSWIEDVDSIRERDGYTLDEGSTLLLNIASPTPRQSRFRLDYQADDWSWEISYLAVLNPESKQLRLQSRVGIENHTDQGYSAARLSLIETEKGKQAPLFKRESQRPKGTLRYTAGSDSPVFEQQISSVREVTRFDLPNRLDLPAKSTVFVPFMDKKALPYTLDYTYDGVLFDRFQRNRRNDWNYGTESHNTVDVYLSIDPIQLREASDHLPGGRFRAFEETAEGNLKLLGDQTIDAFPLNMPFRFRMGAAAQVKAERNRIGYAEITPLHEYEESFEIRLENTGSQERSIRVVEHAYRWPEYEIVKADAEYEETGEQTVEFVIPLKPSGTRTIHYTIRYRW